MKRFYTCAAATAEGTVELDGRPLRTPARAALLLPSAALASAIAAEWNAQGDSIAPRSMALTGLANAAIDRVGPDPQGFAATLSRFAETELLAYRAEGPAALVARQAAGWDPLLDWARRRYDIAFTIVTGIVHRAQPEATLTRLAAAYAALDPFRLAALQPVVTITGSAVIGLAVAAGHLDARAAYDAGHLDANWQAEQWRKDPLAEAAEAERRADLAAAVTFVTLL